jgi:hypothetical protein
MGPRTRENRLLVRHGRRTIYPSEGCTTQLPGKRLSAFLANPILPLANQTQKTRTRIGALGLHREKCRWRCFSPIAAPFRIPSKSLEGGQFTWAERPPPTAVYLTPHSSCVAKIQPGQYFRLFKIGQSRKSLPHRRRQALGFVYSGTPSARSFPLRSATRMIAWPSRTQFATATIASPRVRHATNIVAIARILCFNDKIHSVTNLTGDNVRGVKEIASAVGKGAPRQPGCQVWGPPCKGGGAKRGNASVCKTPTPMKRLLV